MCAGSDHRERRQSGSSLREFDDAFDMSRRHEPTRTTEQKERSSQGSHNENARGVRHEIVVSVVPVCSGTRVCHEQGRGRLHWFRGPVNQECGTGREVPTDHEVPGQENAVTAARVKSRRRATNNSREETGLANQVTSTVEQGQSAHGLEPLGKKTSQT